MTLKFWIRVNARLTRDPDVQAFAFALMPKLPAWHSVRLACGLLIDLWGNVADERENGDLNDVPDGALELWAGWGGKRGHFATEFRARFLDEKGFIKEWQTYQGTLMERRADDRERKRIWREQEKQRRDAEKQNRGGKSAPRPQDNPQDVQRTSTRNGNDHHSDSEPKGSESQSGAPLPLAPSGARPALNNGVPGSPPMRDDELHAEYTAYLADRAKLWLEKHPDRAAEFEMEARVHLSLVNKAELSRTQREMLEQEIYEAVRIEKHWPSYPQWLERRGAA